VPAICDPFTALANRERSLPGGIGFSQPARHGRILAQPRKEAIMTSLRQIKANRRNAAKSTGPRTEAGKAAATLNSMRHGLLARELLVKGESEEDFTGFAEGVRARLAPVGELEIFVVNRLISAAWRLRRAVAIEASLFNSKSGPIGAVGKMQLLSRYEVTLERSLYKALEKLDQLQRLRRARNLEIGVLRPDEADELGSFRKNTEMEGAD